MDNKLSRVVHVSLKNETTTKTTSASPLGLSLTYRRVGRNVVVEVCGELDLASAPQLERGLTDVIDDQGCHSIVVDLQSLEFIDSTGLMVLLRATQLARARRASITLARPNAVTLRVLELSGLRSEFDIRDTMPKGTA